MLLWAMHSPYTCAGLGIRRAVVCLRIARQFEYMLGVVSTRGHAVDRLGVRVETAQGAGRHDLLEFTCNHMTNLDKFGIKRKYIRVVDG